VIVLLDNQFGTAFGISTVAKDAVLALVIFVINTALMYAGRTRALALVPGMFCGFASYFATVFGGFGFLPHNPLAAWLSVVLMNALDRSSRSSLTLWPLERHRARTCEDTRCVRARQLASQPS